MKLGKKPARHDERTLKLASYLKPLPTPPTSCDYTKGVVDWGMMLNDTLGDCTIAGVGHAVQVWTLNRTGEVTVPDSVILQYYEQWDGYNPADSSTDQGGVELDVLNKWRKAGFDGHALLAYADLEIAKHEHVMQSVFIFGGLYIGLNLPLSAQNQSAWDVVEGPDGEPGSWGGHAVFVPGYNPTGPFCITWGAIKQMTWKFWDKYVDEAHALLSADFANGDAVDMATLQRDLREVTA